MKTRNLIPFIPMTLLIICCFVISCLKEETTRPSVFKENATITQSITYIDLDNLPKIDFGSRSGVNAARFYASGSGTIHNAYISTNLIQEAVKISDVDSTTYVKVSPSSAWDGSQNIANFDITWHKKDGTKLYAYGLLSKYYGTDTHTDNYRYGSLHVNHPYNLVSFTRTNSYIKSIAPFRGEDSDIRVWVTKYHKTLQDSGKVVSRYSKEPLDYKTKQFSLTHYFIN